MCPLGQLEEHLPADIYVYAVHVHARVGPCICVRLQKPMLLVLKVCGVRVCVYVCACTPLR